MRHIIHSIFWRICDIWRHVKHSKGVCYQLVATNFLVDLLFESKCQCSCGTLALREIMIAIEPRLADSLLYVGTSGHIQLIYRDERGLERLIETTSNSDLDAADFERPVPVMRTTRTSRGFAAFEHPDWINVGNLIRLLDEEEHNFRFIKRIAKLVDVRYLWDYLTGVYKLFGSNIVISKRDGPNQKSDNVVLGEISPNGHAREKHACGHEHILCHG